MENNQLTKEPRKRSNNIKWLLLYFIALIGVASGVYLWQHSNVNNLNKKISQLNKTNNKNNPATLSTESFIYSPQIGGLTLKLPKSYGIVVNIDGNKGGANIYFWNAKSRQKLVLFKSTEKLPLFAAKSGAKARAHIPLDATSCQKTQCLGRRKRFFS
jgi:hypothetical protein